MRIALVGRGKMGKAVETLALEKGHTCLYGAGTDQAEVCIDFSDKRRVKETALTIRTPWVLGTTGWSPSEIFPIVQQRGIPLLYAPNFSLGVGVLRRLVQLGARLCPGSAMEGVEIHHTEKKEAPSGTALQLMEENPGLSFTSLRQGKEVGTHTVFFKWAEESLELTHRARSREVFAQGAILAAEWLIHQKGGIYSFDTCIEEITRTCLKE